MDLLIIRHGRPERIEPSDAIASGIAADPGLTDVGQAQAEAMAAWLSEEAIDAIYTSPMRRALETAAPLEKALDLKATVEPGIEEFDDGHGYIPMEDLKKNRDQWRKAMRGFDNTDLSGFRKTVVDAITAIIGNHRGDTVALVCHGGVINAWAAEVLGLEQTMFFGPEYTSINRFRASSSGFHSIVSLNESAHLRPDRLHRMP